MNSYNFSANINLLQARADMLRILLRNKDVLVSAYPRLLLLNLALQAARRSSLNSFRVTDSIASSLEILGEAKNSIFMLISEHLKDGYGLDLLQAAKLYAASHKCILVLTHNNHLFVKQALHAGAKGVILEQSIGCTGALIYAVEQVNKGGIFIDPAFKYEENNRAIDHSGELTVREVEILQLVAEGLSNREIGDRLHIAASTARDHVREILRRLGVKSRAAAAVEGLRKGYCL